MSNNCAPVRAERGDRQGNPVFDKFSHELQDRQYVNLGIGLGQGLALLLEM